MTTQTATVKLNGPQGSILFSNKARNLFHAGQGSGKTHIMGALSFMFKTHLPKSIGFIGANTYEQLSKSTLLEIFKVWKEYFGLIQNVDYVVDKHPLGGWTEPDVTLKSYNNTICFHDGTIIFVGSLDNYKAHEGKTLGWAMLDETADTRPEAVTDVIIARLRQQGVRIRKNPEQGQFKFCWEDHPDAGEALNPLFIFTKPSKEEWLAEMFSLSDHRAEIESTIYSKTDYYCGDFENKRVVIASTYHNQPNLPPNYIEDRKLELPEDRIKMLIYGSPFGKTGAEYYSAFNHDKHVGSFGYVPKLQLHLTFDFNVHPYMPGAIWQIIPADKSDDGRTKARCIHEFKMKAPRNTIEDLCSVFRAEFGHLCTPGLFYYGDATGGASQPLKTVKNYFNVIEKELGVLVGPRSKRILRMNPRTRAIGKQTMGRRDFVNACLKGAFGFDIEMDLSCTALIADMQFIKEDKNGAKLKEKVKIDEVVCEKHGHLSDAMDYFLAWNWGEFYR